MLLDRHFLERLERLTIHWHRSFPGLVGGHNRSHFAGAGLEFLDHRNFHHGDDLRAVNWRAYMRLDKMFLKMFQIEPRVPVRMLLDCSHSMAPGAPEKFDYARRLAAALCYVGLVRLDTIEVLPFAARLGEGKTCGGGRHRFAGISQYLESLKAEGETAFVSIVRSFLNNYPQRGLVIILSDFLSGDSCEQALQYLADYGNELMLIQLWTDEDRVPSGAGECDLEEAETGARLRIVVDADARRRYTDAFDRYADSLRRMAMRNGGKYAGLPTSAPLEEAVFGSLARVQSIA